jgi:DNA polymerase-3 subunit epsilon
MFTYQKPLVFIDIETTGISPRVDRIIEVAAIRHEPGKMPKTFTSLVNPECMLPDFITRMTGIEQDEVDQAPLFCDIAEDLNQFLEGSLFVAHNASFDYGFIKNEMQTLDLPFDVQTLCTVRLARKLYPELKKHSLSFLIDHFDITMQNRHRALDDTQVIIDFLNIATQEKGLDTVHQHIQALIK